MLAANETNTVGTSEIDGAVLLPVSPEPVTIDPAQLPHGDRAGAPPRATEVLKVSTRSRPSAVAGAIAGVLRQHDHTEVQAIGAGATNQAVKAIAIARAYLHDDGIDAWFVPSFIDVVIDGQDRTALRLRIQRWSAE
jgi:stage V sporulation protein S